MPVIGTKRNKNGKFELHSSVVGSPNEYHTIIKTHDSAGKSLQNSFGGYNPIHVGNPKYIAKHWAGIKHEMNEDFKTVQHAIEREGKSANSAAAIAAAIGRKKYGKKKFQAAAKNHHKLCKEMNEEFEQFMNEYYRSGADKKRVLVRGPNGKPVWRFIRKNVKINPDEPEPDAKENDDDANWQGVTENKEETMLDEATATVHVAPTTKHKNGKPLYRVIKSTVDRVKTGEHLSDTQLDDLSELGHKIKHIKEENTLFEQVMNQLFEGRRGRPRKNPVPATAGAPVDDEQEADRHIAMQLRKSVYMRGLKHVEFANGEKVQVRPDHANKFLTKYDSMKPNDREEMQKKARKSHADFLNVINS